VDLFLQRIFDGLTNGTVYASVALALVIIYKSTGLLNFAQGEMATFATYIALILTSPISPALPGTGLASWLPRTPWPIWLAIPGAMLAAMMLGATLERAIIRPLQERNSSAIAVVSVTLGLFLFINSLTVDLWFPVVRAFPNPFPAELDDYFEFGRARLRFEDLGIWFTVLAVLGVLFVMLRYTKAGLAFRVISSDREHAQLMGIHPGRTLMLGWALAAAIGALAGSLVANNVLLESNMMIRLLIFSFAAATLGGLDSPGGAIVGGLSIGLIQTMSAGYIPFINSDLSMITALIVIFIVLLIRPAGLFGTRRVERV